MGIFIEILLAILVIAGIYGAVQLVRYVGLLQIEVKRLEAERLAASKDIQIADHSERNY